MSPLRLEPHQAKPISRAKDAWWYEEAKRISVYIESTDGVVVSCEIPRRSILQWLERTQQGSEG